MKWWPSRYCWYISCRIWSLSTLFWYCCSWVLLYEKFDLHMQSLWVHHSVAMIIPCQLQNWSNQYPKQNPLRPVEGLKLGQMLDIVQVCQNFSVDPISSRIPHLYGLNQTLVLLLHWNLLAIFFSTLSIQAMQERNSVKSRGMTLDLSPSRAEHTGQYSFSTLVGLWSTVPLRPNSIQWNWGPSPRCCSKSFSVVPFLSSHLVSTPLPVVEYVQRPYDGQWHAPANWTQLNVPKRDHHNEKCRI